MDASLIMSVLEKGLSLIPKKCKELDLILENFYKAITTYEENGLNNCIDEILSILLANSDHNKGLYDLKGLKTQKFKKEDKEDLNEIVKFADLLVDYEKINKSYTTKYEQKVDLLKQINLQKEICERIYLKRVNK